MTVKRGGCCSLALTALLTMSAGCPKQPPAGAPATKPTTTSAPATTRPVTTARAEKPPAPPPPEEKPKAKSPARPSGPDWARVNDVNDPDLDAAIKATVTEGNRLRIKSDNIRVLRLDLTKLPTGSAQRGPWNLMIDDQAFELTGKRGKQLTFVRSPGGRWEVSD